MGDGGASKAARRAAQQTEETQRLLAQRVADQRAKEAKDAERAQRIMMRSLRGGGRGIFLAAANNPILGDSSGVLG